MSKTETFNFGHMETAIEMGMLIQNLMDNNKIKPWVEDSFSMYRDIADWSKEFEEKYNNIDCDTFGFYDLVEDFVENKFNIRTNENLKRPKTGQIEDIEKTIDAIQYFNEHAAFNKHPDELTIKEDQARKGLERNLQHLNKIIENFPPRTVN